MPFKIVIIFQSTPLYQRRQKQNKERKFHIKNNFSIPVKTELKPHLQKKRKTINIAESNKINFTTFPPPARAKWCPEDFMKYLETCSQSWYVFLRLGHGTEEHHPLNISSVTDKLLMVLFFSISTLKSSKFPLFH